MSEILDLPTIDETLVTAEPAAPAAPPTAIATSIDAVRTEVAKLDPIKAGLADLQRRHPPNAVIAAIDTPKGLALAEDAWRAWRNPRLAVERTRRAAKAPLLALGRAVDAFAGELEDTLRAGEDHYKAQITAEETRRAAAKAEADRIEAERIAGHQAGIAQIRAYLKHCQQPGMTSDRIARGIATLEAIVLPPEMWDEFAAPAATAQCETLEAMRKLQAEVAAREAQAAETERLRALAEAQAAELAALRAQAEERARLEREAADAEAKARAEDQAAEQRRQDEAAAEVQRQANAALESAQSRQEAAATTAADLLPRAPSSAAETIATQAATNPWPPNHPARPTASPVMAMPKHEPAALKADDPAILNLGTISGRLGFQVSAAFLADVLCISPAATDKRALLFRESQFPVICRGIASHVFAMAELYAGEPA